MSIKRERTCLMLLNWKRCVQLSGNGVLLLPNILTKVLCRENGQWRWKLAFWRIFKTYIYPLSRLFLVKFSMGTLRSLVGFHIHIMRLNSLSAPNFAGQLQVIFFDGFLIP